MRRGISPSVLALAVLTVVLFGGGLGVGWASHEFSDVPTSAIYHDPVEWIFNRMVTLGCATGLYCPGDFLTRAQMALFMQRLGRPLTPDFLTYEARPGAQDIDASPIVCQTGDFVTTPWPQRAVGFAWVSLQISGTGSLLASLEFVMSTDSGVTWTPVGGQASLAGSAVSGTTEWIHLTQVGFFDTAPSTTLRVGMRINRIGGTLDATDSFCKIMGVGVNRNPTVSPLSGPSWTPGVAPRRR